jgi:tRNA A-37 threonylcarbamoyl transferase component Bud32/tetratricopeptide (TPR) repeat protein
VRDPPTPHPQPDSLQAYGLGKLNPGDALEVERHITACETCRKVLETILEDDFVTLVRRLSRQATIPPPPRLHAGYEVLEEIGRGGMAVVHKARQPEVGRVVALKRILAGAAAAPDELARFHREAKLAAELRHPNIVQVHDYGEQGGLPYLAMEYVEGGTLAARLAETPLPPRESAALAKTLAEAFAYAHGAGVIHRDLKPANVLLVGNALLGVPGDNGTPRRAFPTDAVPKIADFGLARRLDATLHTQAGALIGTPSYMAPEQTTGDPATALPAVDVYALGATLYECLTGRPPFRAATVMETLAQVRTLDPVPPRSLQPGVPRDLETICLKCLAKEPGQRYATAGDLAEDLRRFLVGEPIRARPIGALERAGKWARRKPAAAALALMGFAVAVAAITAAAWHQHTLSAQVDRANANEAEARRQWSQALANFREAHEALDAIFLWLEEDTMRVQEPRTRALLQEISQATIRYYNGVLRDVEGTDPELRLNRALGQVYTARVHHLIGDHAAAQREFEEASRLLANLASEFPENSEYCWQRAYCRYRQATGLWELGRQEEAQVLFREMLTLLTPLAAVASERIRASRLRGQAHYQLALSLLLSPYDNELILEAKEAIGVLTPLVAQDPKNNAHRTFLVESFHVLGMSYALKNQRDRLRAVTRHAEAVVAPFLQNPPRQLIDLRALYLLADLNRLAARADHVAKDSRAAGAKNDRTLAILDLVHRQEPWYREARLCRSGVHYGLALLLEETGRPSEALSEWARAVEYTTGDARDEALRNITRLERAEAQLRLGEKDRAFAEINQLGTVKDLDGPTLLRLAYLCCSALEASPQERREELTALALNCLRRCRAKGYFEDAKRLDEVRTAPQLAPLRSRPEFRNFLGGPRP